MTSAWVLWMFMWTYSSSRETVKPYDSFSTLAACQAGMDREDRFWSKFASSPTDPDTKYWVCLPAPIDPRPSCFVEK